MLLSFQFPSQEFTKAHVIFINLYCQMIDSTFLSLFTLMWLSQIFKFSQAAPFFIFKKHVLILRCFFRKKSTKEKRTVIGFLRVEIVTYNSISLLLESFVWIKGTVKLNRQHRQGKAAHCDLASALPTHSDKPHALRHFTERHFVSIAFSPSLSNCSFVLGYFCGKSGFTAGLVLRGME